MPNGLCNVPDTFVRLMERIFIADIDERCLVYLDAVSVYGLYFNEILQNFPRVHMTTNNAGLRMKLSKMHYSRKISSTLDSSYIWNWYHTRYKET